MHLYLYARRRPLPPPPPPQSSMNRPPQESLYLAAASSSSMIGQFLSWTMSLLRCLLLEQPNATGYAVLAIVLWLLYKIASRPINYVKELSSVGFDQTLESGSAGRWKDKSRSELATEMNRLRKVGNMPPAFPNGWFALIESDTLQKGQVKHVAVLGENFAVFRGEGGNVYVLDAYCPHLGANMAVGGCVKGESLECPFHAWRFAGKDGQCIAIPYAEKVPEFAKARQWPSCEVNSFIFVWYHAQNEDPSWKLSPLAQLAPSHWVYRGRSEFYISAHIQEIPENGADVAHLNAIHGPSLLAGGSLNTSGFLAGGSWARHLWTASWAAQTASGETHKAVLSLRHEFRLFSKFALINMDVNAVQIGPGYVELSIDTTFGKAVILQSVTPVGPMLQRVIHRMYAAPSMPAPFATVIMLGEAIMFKRDIMVWNHKKFEDRPLLVREDRAINRYRRWYSQFYSENSLRLGKSPEGLDW
ncbi:cholesterol 7-desaturase nvd 1 [Neocloeon triangulifer]|uniref:cholesterol 7-desaturase nvd 1 n=1 Tax=Neocloeon triangulifer TaxID=2078957 RepID=UPI00286F3302|nr:cholesterol 7-desaturase nvd 1 [Neocloeon triangulifer]